MVDVTFCLTYAGDARKATRRFKRRPYRVPPRDLFAWWGDPTRPGHRSSEKGPMHSWEVRDRETELPEVVSRTSYGSWVVIVVHEEYFLRKGKVKRLVSAHPEYRAGAAADLCIWCGAVNPSRETDGCCGNCGGN